MPLIPLISFIVYPPARETSAERVTLTLFSTDPPPEEPRELGHLTYAARRQLIAAGYMDAATGATRKARPRRCKGCGRPTWQGIDADYCGQVRIADPGPPLAPLGEAMALFANMPTLELASRGLTFELYRRNRWMIADRPAGATPGRDVLLAHDCEVRSDLLPLPRCPTQLPVPPAVSDLPADAPF